MREVDGVRNGIRIGGVDSDELVALAHLNFATNLEILAGPALFANAYFADHIDERLSTTVEDGKFKVVELDDRVVDAKTNERGEHVLGRRDQHALLHETRGVADAGDIAAVGFDLEAVQVGPTEHDACPRRGRQNAH